jgi:hypothetical protein
MKHPACEVMARSIVDEMRCGAEPVRLGKKKTQAIRCITVPAVEEQAATGNKH